MPTVTPSNAPTAAKNPTARGQVLGTNSIDFIDLNAIVSTATLPYTPSSRAWTATASRRVLPETEKC